MATKLDLFMIQQDFFIPCTLAGKVKIKRLFHMPDAQHLHNIIGLIRVAERIKVIREFSSNQYLMFYDLTRMMNNQ
jgi:hypothetical protein